MAGTVINGMLTQFKLKSSSFQDFSFFIGSMFRYQNGLTLAIF